VSGHHRTPLTPAEHQALGLELAVARDDLEAVTTWLASQRLTGEHRAVRALLAAGYYLDAARAELDDLLWSDRLTGGWTATTYHPDDATRAAWRARRARSAHDVAA
jgi:hypothetical protein